MKRKLMKVFAWGAAIIIGLSLLLYAIIVAINWRDRAPSPLAIKMLEEYRANSNVAVDDNAYVDVMGFAVGPDDDPHAMGLKRIEWMSKANRLSVSQAGPDPQDREYDFKAKRDAKIKSVSTACNRDSHQRFVGVECVNALSDTEALTNWIASESWLLERYQRMIARSAWVDEALSDPTLPFPSYAGVMEGQKLLLAKAMVLAKENRPAEIHQLLASDNRFWRRVLSSTNLLITKMIATVALDRHFAMANIALKQFPPDVQQKAIPVEWRQPISDEERSLHKVMIGEWIFATSLMKKASVDGWDTLIDPPSFDRAPRHHWYSFLGRSFYKQQATINGFADSYSQIGNAGDVDYLSLGGSLAQCDKELNSQLTGGLPMHSAYNPVGQVILAISQSLFSEYIRRNADIEGVRRATLAAIELRESSVKADQVSSALKHSSQTNPYTNEPFEWDQKERVIVFKGLEKGERGEHHIYY